MDVDLLDPNLQEKDSNLPDRTGPKGPNSGEDNTNDLPAPSPLNSPRLVPSSGPARKRPAKDLADENLKRLKELWPSGVKDEAKIAHYLGRETLDKVPPTVLLQLVRLAEACATLVEKLQAERMDTDQTGGPLETKQVQALRHCKDLLAKAHESEKSKRKKGSSSLGVRQLRDIYLKEFVGVVDVDEDAQSESRHGAENLETGDDTKESPPDRDDSSGPTSIQELLGCVLAESLGPASPSEHRLQSRPLNLLKSLGVLGIEVDTGCDIVFRRDAKVLVKPAGWTPRSSVRTADFPDQTGRPSIASGGHFELPADEEKRRSKELKLWDAEHAELSCTDPLWGGFETGQVLAMRGEADDLVCFACAGVSPLVTCKVSRTISNTMGSERADRIALLFDLDV